MNTDCVEIIVLASDKGYTVRVQPQTGVGIFMYFGPEENEADAIEFAALLKTKLFRVVVPAPLDYDHLTW